MTSRQAGRHRQTPSKGTSTVTCNVNHPSPLLDNQPPPPPTPTPTYRQQQQQPPVRYPVCLHTHATHLHVCCEALRRHQVLRQHHVSWWLHLHIRAGQHSQDLISSHLEPVVRGGQAVSCDRVWELAGGPSLGVTLGRWVCGVRGVHTARPCGHGPWHPHAVPYSKRTHQLRIS